jgi:hypothetical protein
MNTKIPDEKGYTQGAWKGAMFDRNLDIKEIAERIKHFCKKQYPTCKFSITIQRYSGGQAMHLALMGAPFDIFATPEIEKVPFSFFGGVERGLEYWKDSITRGHHQVNSYHLKDDFYLNEKGKEIMRFLIDATNVYNYDDSDAQIDYFNTNFYTHFAVGKWDKPFTIK